MAKKAGKADRTKKVANEEHDEGAARDAEIRMTLREGGASDDRASETKAGTSAEMDGEHDPGALEEASERMLLRHDRK
jgi:hypothetical protein